jgi:hypothetical protein
MALVMALLLPHIGVAVSNDIVRLALVGGCGGLVYGALAAVALNLGGFRFRRPRSAAPTSAPPGPAGSPDIPPEPPPD